MDLQCLAKPEFRRNHSEFCTDEYDNDNDYMDEEEGEEELKEEKEEEGKEEEREVKDTNFGLIKEQGHCRPKSSKKKFRLIDRPTERYSSLSHTFARMSKLFPENLPFLRTHNPNLRKNRVAEK